MSYNDVLERKRAEKKKRIRERYRKEYMQPVRENAGVVLGVTALATVGFTSLCTPKVFAEDVPVVVDTNEKVHVTAGVSAELAKMNTPLETNAVTVVRNALLDDMVTASMEQKEAEEQAKAEKEEAKEQAYQEEVDYCMKQPVNVFDHWRTGRGNAVSNSATRTHMSYTAVTARNTMQYKTLNSANSWSSKYTGLRMNGERYCVAVGLKYGKAGDKIDLIMEDGSLVKAIIGDIKARNDTDETNMFQKDDGSIVELITDGTAYDADRVPSVLKQHITRIVNVEGKFE